MNKPYKVKIDGHIIEWKDGEFHCNNRSYLKKIREYAKGVEDAPYAEIELDGSTLYSGKGAKFEKSWAASYAMLQGLSGGRMKFISGDKPSWEALGYKSKDGEIN